MSDRKRVRLDPPPLFELSDDDSEDWDSEESEDEDSIADDWDAYDDEDEDGLALDEDGLDGMSGFPLGGIDLGLSRPRQTFVSEMRSFVEAERRWEEARLSEAIVIPDDVPLALQIPTKQLHTLLGKSGSIGSFGVIAACHVNSNPFLSIEGFGLLRLPIAQEDAVKLYGQQAKSLNTEANSNHEPGMISIDSSALSIGNMHWHKFLEGRRAKYCASMGLDKHSRTSLVFDKLLLYPPGRVFKTARADLPVNSIGYFDILLPGETEDETCEIMISFGKGKKRACISENRCSVICSVWFSDVSHKLVNLKQWQVVLRYRLCIRLEPGKRRPSAKTVSVPPAVPDAIRKIVEVGDPAVYVLQDNYTEADLAAQKFRGKDRPIISNLMLAVKEVEGVGLYCGDLSTVGYRCPGRPDMRDPHCEIDQFDDDQLNWVSSHSLQKLFYLAGLRKDFKEIEEWKGKIYTFGQKPHDVIPYRISETSGASGLVWQNVYRPSQIQRNSRVSCIYLWCTSALRSLKAKSYTPRADRKGLRSYSLSRVITWEEAKDVIVSAGNPTVRDHYEFNKLKAAMKASCCVTSVETMSTNDYADAGIELDDAIKEIQAGDVRELATLFDLLINDVSSFVFNQPSNRHYPAKSLILMLKYFPEDANTALGTLSKVKYQLSKRGLLGSGYIHLLYDAFDATSWKPRDLLKDLFHDVILAQPTVGLLESLDRDMRMRLAEKPESMRLAAIWDSLRYSYGNDFLIKRIRIRYQEIRDTERDAAPWMHRKSKQKSPTLFLIPSSRSCPPQRDPRSRIFGKRLDPKEPLKPEEAFGAPFIQTTGSPIVNQETIAGALVNFLLYLLRPERPASSRTIDQFLDAIRPGDILTLQREYAEAKADEVVRNLIRDLGPLMNVIIASPSYAKDVYDPWSPSAKAFINSYISLLSREFPIPATVPTHHRSLSLAPWKDGRPCTRRGCHLCPRLSTFMVSSIEERLNMGGNGTYKSHFIDIQREIVTEARVRQRTLGVIPFHATIEDTGSTINLTVIKLINSGVTGDYDKYADAIALRKEYFGMAGIQLDAEGKLRQGGQLRTQILRTELLASAPAYVASEQDKENRPPLTVSSVLTIKRQAED